MRVKIYPQPETYPGDVAERIEDIPLPALGLAVALSPGNLARGPSGGHPVVCSHSGGVGQTVPGADAPRLSIREETWTRSGTSHMTMVLWGWAAPMWSPATSRPRFP